jgi:uncharacterized hydrophobic protein (TIGR00271 family)
MSAEQRRRMLQLRVYGESDAMAGVAERLGRIPGARHVTLSAAAYGDDVLVTADLRPDAADTALEDVRRLGVPAADVTLLQLDTIGPVPDEPPAVVWADVLGQARVRARVRGRYVILMAVAGLIAALGVMNLSSILVVGAMAISPDLLPVTAACTGLVLHRPQLAARGVGTLAFGLAVAWVAAAVLTACLNALELLPTGFSIGQIPAAQTHVGVTTIVVALAAGVAGMLAVETRASAAVGVAISVTTIPASAYLGVAAGTAQLRHAWSGLAVLFVNIALMLAGGSLALAVQRTRMSSSTAP